MPEIHRFYYPQNITFLLRGTGIEKSKFLLSIVYGNSFIGICL